jgi:carotenoid cleavage dioxygenase-like enzyme
MNTGKATVSVLIPEVSGDFPVINALYNGYQQRYGYFTYVPEEQKSTDFFEGFIKYDLVERRVI